MKLFDRAAAFFCLFGAALNVALFAANTSRWFNAAAAVLCAGSLAIILASKRGWP